MDLTPFKICFVFVTKNGKNDIEGYKSIELASPKNESRNNIFSNNCISVICKNVIRMPPPSGVLPYLLLYVILNLINSVQFAHARHITSKLGSTLAQSQISGYHREPFL